MANQPRRPHGCGIAGVVFGLFLGHTCTDIATSPRPGRSGRTRLYGVWMRARQ